MACLTEPRRGGRGDAEESSAMASGSWRYAPFSLTRARFPSLLFCYAPILALVHSTRFSRRRHRLHAPFRLPFHDIPAVLFPFAFASDR